MCKGGGGVFAGHYSINVLKSMEKQLFRIVLLYHGCLLLRVSIKWGSTVANENLFSLQLPKKHLHQYTVFAQSDATLDQSPLLNISRG